MVDTDTELHLVLHQDADGNVYGTKPEEQGGYFVTITDGQVDDDDVIDSGSPNAKRQRLMDDIDNTDDVLPSIQEILCSMNKDMCLRLDSIEKKLEMLDKRTKCLEEHFEQYVQKHTLENTGLGKSNQYPSMKTSSGAIIIGVPQEKSLEDDTCDDSSSNHSPKYGDVKVSTSSLECPDLRSLGPNVTLITLNSEEDYPNGSWLGNEGIPDQRVRVPISQSDLLHIESNCRTPEKMALALLDYLFDRDTQACSNLSGMGKHGKKKLDPLFIYGMRCHLVHRFGISEKDWHRLKLNIDSKCRTAFRRKMRGQPLTVKAFRSKSSSAYMYVQVGRQPNGESDEDSSLHNADNVLQITEGTDVPTTVSLAGSSSQFQVIAATPEQVARLKPRLQLLSDGQYVLQTGLDLSGHDGLVQGVSLSTEEIINLVTTESGELIHITPDTDVDTIATAASETGIV